MVIQVIKVFSYTVLLCILATSFYSFVLLLSPCCSVLYCTEVLYCKGTWNVPLVSLIFLQRSLVFPILLLSFISLHCSLKKAFLFLLAILRSSAFSWVYLSLSPLPSDSFLFSAICKASSDNHFTFLHFVFFFFFFVAWFWSLPPVQCYKPPSIVLQALFLPDLIPWIYKWLLLPNRHVVESTHWEKNSIL